MCGLENVISIKLLSNKMFLLSNEKSHLYIFISEPKTNIRQVSFLCSIFSICYNYLKLLYRKLPENLTIVFVISFEDKRGEEFKNFNLFFRTFKELTLFE